MFTTHFVTHGPLTTAYHEAGHGEPFVLVHGYTGSKLDFVDQLHWFTDLRRVIAYDQRGHGESSNLRPYYLDVMVGDLLSFMDTLDITRCDLLGHSMGGMVAMRAALAAPQRFRSLILMNTSASPLTELPAHARRALDELVAQDGCVTLLPGLRAATPTPPQQRGIDWLGEDEHWRRVSVKLQQMDTLAFTELGPRLRSQCLLDRLGELRCPATVLVGEHDSAFVAPSQQLAARLPRACLITIADAAHAPQYENADGWREAVRDHLTIDPA